MTDQPGSERPDSQRPPSDKGVESSRTPWVSTPASSGGSTGAPSEEFDTPGVRRIRQLGEGGFGDVWLVEYLGALEARKYLNKREGSRRDAFREAINTRSVSHRNVVSVTDVTEEEGVSVLRMEYIEGRDLARIVAEDGVIPLEQLIELGVQVADALQATHERNIVHLDLKPSNLILRQKDHSIVVTDFGISAALRQDRATEGDPGGTPYFMAPELHVGGGRGSPHSDMWSLGITLYYLLSNSYPFPFDKMKPAEAVLQEPRKLCESHRYVSEALWSILHRMLQVDPAERFPDMNAAKSALEDYWLSVVCRDCGQPFRYESIAGVCPNPECKSRTIVQLKTAQLARRSAETALLECSFDEAAKGFCAAREDYASVSQSSADVDELDTIITALDGLAEDHDKTTTAIAELFENQRMVECVNRIRQARGLFSRSPRIVTLRQEVRKILVESYRETPSVVKQDLRQREFDKARELLTRMDHLLGDPTTRKELVSALGERPEDYRWLYQEVDQQQELCARLLKQAERAIARFEFQAAFDAYSRLERDFPCEEFRCMLTVLGKAGDLYALAMAQPEEQLRDLLADISSPEHSGHITLEESRNACAALLEDFPPAEYAAFNKVADRVGLLQDAIRSIRDLVSTGIQRADDARAKGRLDEELAELNAIKRAVVRTDVLELSFTEALSQRAASVGRSVEESNKLYAEAGQAMAGREYQRVLTALDRLAQIAPKVYPDTPEIRQRAEDALSQIRELRTTLAEEFARIERGESSLDNIVETLHKYERWNDLVDEGEQRRLLGSLSHVFTVLVNKLTDYVGGLSREQSDSEDNAVVTFLFAEFMPIVAALPASPWSQLIHQSAETRRAICSLMARALPEATAGLSPVLSSGRQVMNLMRGDAMGPLVKDCEPPPGSEHPARSLAHRIVLSFGKARRDTRQLLYSDAAELLRQLGEVCPAEVAAEIEQDGREVKRLSTQDRWAEFMSRNVRRAITYLPAAVIATIAFVAGMFLTEGSSNRVFAVQALEQPEVKGLLDDVPGLRNWAIESEDDLSQRLRFVYGWARMRTSTQNMKVRELASRTADAVQRLGAIAKPESPRGKDLVENFDSDLRTAMDLYLAALSERAEQLVGRGSPDGSGGLRWLLDELSEQGSLLAGHAEARRIETARSQIDKVYRRVRNLRKDPTDSASLKRARARIDQVDWQAIRPFLRSNLAVTLVAGLAQRAEVAAMGDTAGFDELCTTVFNEVADLSAQGSSPAFTNRAGTGVGDRGLPAVVARAAVTLMKAVGKSKRGR